MGSAIRGDGGREVRCRRRGRRAIGRNPSRPRGGQAGLSAGSNLPTYSRRDGLGCNHYLKERLQTNPKKAASHAVSCVNHAVVRLTPSLPNAERRKTKRRRPRASRDRCTLNRTATGNKRIKHRLTSSALSGIALVVCQHRVYQSNALANS